MRLRNYIAIMASSLLVILAFTSGLGLFEDPPGVRDASFTERLYYAAAAKLARHGVRAYCSGIERDGATVRIDLENGDLAFHIEPPAAGATTS